MREGAEGGLYGFARDENGWMKIGYRGTKYTNPIKQADGVERSVPVTRYTTPVIDGKLLTSVPSQGFEVIKRFVSTYLPELAEQGFDVAKTRVCWYNDSYDNHLLIDRVPTKQGLAVATAGSGHAFKYLPVVGKYVTDMLEGMDLDRPTLKAWRWRKKSEGEVPSNVLMEGIAGVRALDNIKLIAEPSIKSVKKDHDQLRARL